MLLDHFNIYICENVDKIARDSLCKIAFTTSYHIVFQSQSCIYVIICLTLKPLKNKIYNPVVYDIAAHLFMLLKEFGESA